MWSKRGAAEDLFREHHAALRAVIGVSSTNPTVSIWNSSFFHRQQRRRSPAGARRVGACRRRSTMAMRIAMYRRDGDEGIGTHRDRDMPDENAGADSHAGHHRARKQRRHDTPPAAGSYQGRYPPSGYTVLSTP